MDKCCNKVILYGIGDYARVIDCIIGDLNMTGDGFDIRLILTEAISNAYIHGNQKDDLKPISISYEKDIREEVRFTIEDCGKGFELDSLLDCLSESSILKDCGRGVYLIKSLADQVETRQNQLIIKTKCNKA